jgi:DNA polymerase III subunit gamma/tau
VSGEAISSILGLVSSEAIRRLADLIAQGDAEAAIRLLDTIVAEGKDLPHFVSDLSGHFRNLLILKVADSSLLGLPADAVSVLDAQVGLFSREQLLYIIETLTELESKLKWSLSKRVLLEVTLLRLAESRHRVGIGEIVDKLHDLKDRLAEGASEADPEEVPPAQEPVQTVDGVREKWQEVLDAVGKEKPLLKSYLMEGEPLAIEGDTLTICFQESYDFHREGLEDFNNKRFVEAVIEQVLGRNLRVNFKVMKQACKRVKKKAKKDSRLCRNPQVQKAISVFNAEIVDIRK